MSVRQESLIDEKPNNSHRRKTQLLKLQTHSIHAVWLFNIKADGCATCIQTSTLTAERIAARHPKQEVICVHSEPQMMVMVLGETAKSKLRKGKSLYCGPRENQLQLSERMSENAQSKLFG